MKVAATATLPLWVLAMLAAQLLTAGRMTVSRSWP
jgi:hypothetical protein